MKRYAVCWIATAAILALVASEPMRAEDETGATPSGEDEAQMTPAAEQSLGDVLSGAEGVRVATMCTNCNVANVTMCGQTGDKVQVWQDGLPVIGGLGAIYVLSVIPAEAVANTDVVRGAGTALSGPEVGVGALLLRTKTPKKAPSNGMAPTLISLMKEGWLTHLAKNGAGIIHDWEFAGQSSEDVRENVKEGKFGIWDETGFYINLALIVGAWEGLGYGESVGKMISRDGLDLPEPDLLYETAKKDMLSDPARAASAIDLAGIINKFGLKPGFMEVRHPYKQYSVQASAFDLGIPFTGHPMIGHDIIYNHPVNHGAALGRCALRDFLCGWMVYKCHCLSWV